MSFNYEPMLAAAAAACYCYRWPVYVCACSYTNYNMYDRRRQVLTPPAALHLSPSLAIIESSGIDCDQRLNQFRFSLSLSLLSSHQNGKSQIIENASEYSQLVNVVVLHKYIDFVHSSDMCLTCTICLQICIPYVLRFLLTFRPLLRISFFFYPSLTHSTT